MATNVGTLRVRLTGDSRGLDRMLRGAEGSIDRTAKKVGAIGRRLSLGVTVPLLGIGVAATSMGVEFDREVTKINTLVGVASEQTQKWRKDLIELGPAVGRAPTELSRALFVVTSAGERTSRALDIVEESAKASAIGLGDTATIARSVTAAMQAYGAESLSATRAVEILTATVREGNLESEALAGSLGRIIGIASAVGVSFEEVGAFIATFTRLGVSAEESVTALRGVMTTLLKPSDQAREALAGVGLSIEALRDSIRSRGLTRTLVDLVGLFKGNEDALAAVIPNVRALAGVLGTAGAQGEQFEEILRNIRESVGIVDDGFATVSDTIGFKLDQVQARLRATGLAIAELLIPHVEDAISVVDTLVGSFNRLDESQQKTVVRLGAIAAAAGPALLALAGMAAGARAARSGWRALRSALETGAIAFLLLGDRIRDATLLSTGLATKLTRGGVIGAAIFAATGLIVGMANAWRRAGEEAQKARDDFRDAIGEMDPGTAQETATALERDRADALRRFGEVQAALQNAQAAGATALASSLRASREKIRAELQRIDEDLRRATERARSGIAALPEVGVSVERTPSGGGGGSAERAKTIADAMKTLAAELQTTERMNTLLGDSYDVTSAKADAYATALSALVPIVSSLDENLDGNGTTVRSLAARYSELEAAVEAAKEAKENAADVTRIIDALERENAEIRGQAAALVDAELAAKNATEAQRDYARFLQRSTEVVRKNAEIQREANEAVEAAVEKARQARSDEIRSRFEAIQDAAGNMAQAVVDAGVDIVTGSESIGEAFKNMVDRILRELARLAIQQALFGLLKNVFSGVLGGGIPDAPGPIEVEPPTIPGFARGGSVSRGVPIVVGEEGPEVFTPGISGTVHPNDAMGIRGGAPVSVTFQIDAIDGRSVERFFGENANRIVRIVGEAVQQSDRTSSLFDGGP